MTNYKSPETLAMSIHAYIIATNIIFGAYLWEWVFTLDFDLQYLRGKKRFTLAAASYFLTRYMMLGVWILGMRITNVFEPIDCTAWNYGVHVLAYGALSFASLLLLLRVAALSSRNVVVMLFLWTFYLATWAVSIWGMYNSHANYIPALHICAPTDLKYHRINSIMSYAFDSCCVLLMMFYLLRSRCAKSKSQAGSLWSLILQQGTAYAACIAAAYIPVIALLHLDLNDAISQTANSFALLIVTVCATRMHRGLVLYHEATSKNNKATSLSQVTDGMIKFNVPTVALRKESMSITVSVDKFDDSETPQDGSYPMERFVSNHGKASAASLHGYLPPEHV